MSGTTQPAPLLNIHGNAEVAEVSQRAQNYTLLLNLCGLCANFVHFAFPAP